MADTAHAQPERPRQARNSPSFQDPLLLVGSVIDGRYLAEAIVAKGGFGVVYRARHLQFDSPVALKVFIREVQSDGSAAGTWCEGPPPEGRLLFKLAPLHSAFVRVYECGLIDRGWRGSLPYLAMEWLDGLTLKAHLEAIHGSRTGLPLCSVLHLFDDLAQGLGMAHARRVAHRDLKPANVFLTVCDGRVMPKLLDFGLAKEGSLIRDTDDDTSLGECPFTPAYAAPEQWQRSLGATGSWTDVYAVALMSVELLSGRAWSGDIARPDLMGITLDRSRRPTPRARGVEVSDEVETVFSKALAVDPHARYPDIGAFWQDLCAAAAWSRPARALCAHEVGIPGPEDTGTHELETSETQAPERATAEAHRPTAGSPRASTQDSSTGSSCRPSYVDSIARVGSASTGPARRKSRIGWTAVGAVVGSALLVAASSRLTTRHVPRDESDRTGAVRANHVASSVAPRSGGVGGRRHESKSTTGATTNDRGCSLPGRTQPPTPHASASADAQLRQTNGLSMAPRAAVRRFAVSGQPTARIERDSETEAVTALPSPLVRTRDGNAAARAATTGASSRPSTLSADDASRLILEDALITRK